MSEIKYFPVPTLKSSPFRFPIRNNTYEIAPGFSSIGMDQVFIDDENKNLYLTEKQKCLGEDPDKYFCYLENYSSELKAVTNELCGGDCFHEYSLSKQQDLALVKVSTGTNIAISLAFPNHWDPREKLGRDFIATHLPVPDMEAINKNHQLLLKSCLEKGPYERYAWGLSSDTRLNHHPTAPKGMDEHEWYGRKSDRVFMRIERQSLLGFHAYDCVLFTIHTYFLDINALSGDHRHSLLKAIQSMSADTLKYKGINKDLICQKLLSIKT